MSRVRRTGVVLALIAVAAFGATAITGATAAKKTKTVGVFDDYFSPELVKIRKGDKVKWVWDEFSTGFHDVTVIKKPRGTKKFHSKTTSAPYSYRHRFTKRGRYKLICTVHSGSMRMTVRVRR
jgi:plastocyanin